jgi:hypothetical protein
MNEAKGTKYSAYIATVDNWFNGLTKDEQAKIKA